jgi:DHA1 family bicyclomycin/chloramphenicol resistance-like MFS transporter
MKRPNVTTPSVAGPPAKRSGLIEVSDGRRSMGGREVIGLLAMVMAIVALAVDIILPAFADIRADFGLATDSTAAAGLITTFLLGMALSQVFYGVLADRFGRKPILYTGIALYIAGALASAFAPSLGWLLAARFVWGAGAAAPRVLTLSVLRDIYSGERMAKAMSFVMAIFILVPVVAPSLGAVLTSWITWRGAVGFTVVVAVLVGIWTLRLPETLRPENRLDLTWADVGRAARIVLTNRVTVGYMLAFTALFGSFASYLASSELIFADVFGLAEEFPVIFGALAVVMGVAVLINGNLVERVGLQKLIRLVMIGYLISAVALNVISLLTGGVPPFWLYAVGLAVVFSMHALLIPNMNAAAMIPMASVAGTASAIIGTVATAGGALLGAVIDRAYDGTVAPLSLGFLVLGLVAWLLCRSAEAGMPSVAMEPAPEPVH